MQINAKHLKHFGKKIRILDKFNKHFFEEAKFGRNIKK